MAPTRQHQAPALLLDLLIVATGAVLLLTWMTGGLLIPIGVATVSVRQPLRPAVILVGLLAARYLFRAGQRIVRRETWPDLPLLTLSAAAVGYSLVYLTTNCGGADSYGYVSAALLIRHGTLSVPQPDLSWLPASNALSVLTPLGYAPRALDGTIVPHYPLGFPALIAVASLVFPTSIAPYLVSPICGVAALVLTYLIASRLTAQHATAWLAVALVAWDPLVMTYAKQPMSDLPAAVFFLVALWCLLRDQPATLSAGLAAGAAFVIRPGGLGAIAALGVLAIWLNSRPATGDSARRFGDQVRAGVMFAIGVMPAIAFQALLQWRLFGSPLRTGYGALEELYAGQSLADNARIYSEALLMTHVPIWLLLVVSAFIDPRIRGFAAWSLVLIAASITPYLLYFRFDHWETLRFILPAVIVLDILAAAGAARLLQRVTPVFRAAAIIALAAFVAIHAGTFLRRQGVPLLMDQERRYTLTADWIDQYTPATTLVIAGQHSGSVRHYAGRTTLRWDLLDPRDLEPVVRGARERGRPVFAVLEGNEQAAFRDRFAPVLASQTDVTGVRLLPGAQVRNVQIWEVVPATRESR